MSTLSVGTIKSTSTSPPTVQNSSGTQIGTFCRAWVSFNGTGTVAINASFNVTSITDNGTGDYTVNFTNALPDANYAWCGSVDGTGNSTNGNVIGHGPTNTYPIIKSTTQLRVVTQNAATSAQDCAYTSVAIFR